MAHPNLDIVKRMYDCFNVADLETIRKEIFHPDMVWNLPGHHPLGGTKNGPDEVLAFFHELNKANIQVTLVHIDSWGEETVVEVHRGQGKSGNAVLDALNCTHYHIRDGKIDRVQVYISDQYAVDTFFWSVFSLKPIPERLG